MLYDIMKVPIKNRDCVVVLTDEFAKYSYEGKNLEYGIIYEKKWVLPLNGEKKKQFLASDYVKLMTDELLPEIKEKLLALYEYYDKFQKLPLPGLDIVSIMRKDIEKYGHRRIYSPFDKVKDSDSSLDDEELEEDDDYS